MLNTFRRISLFCKSISLFEFYFIVGLRANQRLYLNLGYGLTNAEPFFPQVPS